MSTVEPTSSPSPPTESPRTDEVEAWQCARHPKVETLLRCGRCETPICPKCMVQTPVGMRCPTCAPVKRLSTGLKPRELAWAGLLGLGVAVLGTIIALQIPFLRLIGMALVGFGTGHVVLVAGKYRRGRELAILATACFVVGSLLAPVVLLLAAGRAVPLEFIPLLITGTLFNPLLLLSLLMGGLLAWMRAR